MAAPAAAQAISGRLDPSFGTSGWTVTPPGTAGGGRVAQLSLAPEGAPVVADLAEGNIVHLLSDGSVDTGFGSQGRLHLGLSTASEGDDERTFVAAALAVDPAGRVVVFGSQDDQARSVPVTRMPGGMPSSYALVLRLEPSGVLDPTFGGGKGFVRSDFGLTSQLSSKVPLIDTMGGTVDAEGRPVLVAGAATVVGACLGKGGVEELPRAVVRLTSSGELDPTFGSGGKSLIDGTQSASLLLADEDRLAVGTGPIGGSKPECREGGTVYRLGPAGERSTEFGPHGVRSFKQMHLAALEPPGGVIVDRRQGHTLTLSRRSPSGAPDPGFGRRGEVKIALPAKLGSEIPSVLVDEEGRILLVGFVGGNPAKHQRAAFVIGRVLTDGKLDPEFGTGGWVTTPFPRPLELTSAQAKLDAQGRLVVVGAAVRPGDSNGGFLVARYLMGS